MAASIEKVRESSGALDEGELAQIEMRIRDQIEDHQSKAHPMENWPMATEREGGENFLGRYILFLTWIAAVTVGFVYLYVHVFSSIWWWWAESFAAEEILDLLYKNWSSLGHDQKIVWLTGLTLKVVAGILLWWRLLKIVLQGSPFAVGMLVGSGRQDLGKSGRRATLASIGDIDVYGGEYKGSFWYAGVFRAHPSSDKLVRARLELLVLALPFDLTLSCQESSWFLRKGRGHRGRAQMYRLVADRYTTTREIMAADRFREHVVRELRKISGHFDKVGRRIDGLNWMFYNDGGGSVMDDFGYRISFSFNQGDGSYTVKETGGAGEGEAVVYSVAELRELAKRELNPAVVKSGVDK